MLHGGSVMKAASSGRGRSAGHAIASGNTMVEQPTSESFIVRVYRVDAQDERKISGLVEALDGSGESEPFTLIDVLGAILKRRLIGRYTTS